MTIKKGLSVGRLPQVWVAVTLAFMLLLPLNLKAADSWHPYPVEVWDPPFDMASPRATMDYMAFEKAEKQWDIFVSFPHM